MREALGIDAAAIAGGSVDERDLWLADLAAAQDGTISRRQLTALGYSKKELETLIRRRRLHRVFRGVYAVGHTRIGPYGLYHAAVLATEAGLSHRCGADVHGVLAYSSRTVHLSTTGQAHRRPGLVVHRREHVELEVVEGLLVTTLAQTLLDIAATQRRERLDDAINQAMVLGTYDQRAIDAIAAHRRPGSAALRAARPNSDVPVILRSELERRFLRLVGRAGLPLPLCNHHLHGWEVDFYWPGFRLVVEVDGVRIHGTPRARRRDRCRDNTIQLGGDRILRYTWNRVTQDGRAVGAELDRALRPRGA